MLVQYSNANGVYYAFAFDNSFGIQCSINQAFSPADAADFETVFIPIANSPNTSSFQIVPTSLATLSNATSSASNVTLIASNGARKGLTIFNDSTAILYVKFGTTASTTSFTVKMTGGAYYEMPTPVYTGIVDGIWDSANGAARITEFT
jgi:hypothetical protein